jgi:hypothetical protein
MKEKQEDQEKRAQSQEDKSDRPHDLEFIQLLNPSLRFPLNYFF